MIQQFSRTTESHEERLGLYPPIGSEIDAVVEQVSRFGPPAYARLTIRPADLRSFTWPCDFCGGRATMSPGGDGLVLDVRSNDGPGSTTVIAHRTCLADRIRPENRGERARVLAVGKDR